MVDPSGSARLVGLLVGQDLYKVGTALAGLGNLDQHVKRVCKVRDHPQGDKKKVKQRKVCLDYWKTDVTDWC